MTAKTILILAANPRDTQPLRLEKEVRDIEEALRRAPQGRDRFRIVQYGAVQLEDLRRALLEHKPQILHFSGHGVGDRGLVFEDEQGKSHLADSRGIANLLRLRPELECVMLNACYSDAQAQVLEEAVSGCLIGMKQAVGDDAARKFAIGFYDGLFYGESVEQAFQYGMSALDLERLPDQPVLRWGKRVGANAPNTPPGSDVGNSLEDPDSPSIELETPEGQVALNSAFYVERPPIEVDCYRAIQKPGALIRIKAPRQMGKTSLMSRILAKAMERESGCRAVSLSFQEADGETFANLDSLLRWFCGSIADALGLDDQLERRWKGILGSNKNCSKYFQDYLLPAIQGSLVLGLDEVDRVFNYPSVATDFFGLLRAWHERAKNEPLWQRLKLVIVHSKEVYVPLEINQSPFNVGLPIELPELTLMHVQDLARRHGLVLGTDAEVLMKMIGGHPYLVRVALYQLALGRITLTELLQVAPTEEGPFSDHLRRHLLNLEEHEDLCRAMKQLLLGNGPVKVGVSQIFKLRSMGLVRLRGNTAEPSCDLYRHYFRNHLGVGG